MKKSRIVIPALALIAFSVAASITGTVAWFTANRQAHIDTGTYAVVKTNADLSCELTAGVGTGSVDNASDTKSVTATGVLTDASVDHSNGTVFAPDSAGKKVASKTVIFDTDYEDDLERGEKDDHTVIYSAITFDVKFSIEFGAATVPSIGLYLDTHAQTNSVYDTRLEVASPQSASPSTAKGFRMAFIPKNLLDNNVVLSSGSSANSRVWAGLREQQTDAQTPVTKAYYLSDANYDVDDAIDINDGDTYGTNQFIDKNYHVGMPPVDQQHTALADYTGRPDYLGTFGYIANTTVDLTFTVVCWFEGTDEEIYTRSAVSDYQSVAAHLAFNTVDLPNA